MTPAQEETLEGWVANPSLMFKWRSRMFRVILLILEDMIVVDPGGDRTKRNERVRAIGQFQAIAAAMEEYRMDQAIVCPHCSKEFNLE